MSQQKAKYPKGKHPNSLANLKKGWKPGQSGNPKGRPPGIKYVSEALREQLANDPALVDMLAKKLIERAKENSNDLNLLFERTEGKVTQPISGEGGGPIEVNIDYKRKIISAISRHAAANGEDKGDPEP